jgi:hypothetical protein
MALMMRRKAAVPMTAISMTMGRSAAAAVATGSKGGSPVEEQRIITVFRLTCGSFCVAMFPQAACY